MKSGTLSKIIVTGIVIWIAIFVWRKIDVTYLNPRPDPAPAGVEPPPPPADTPSTERPSTEGPPAGD